ncbi:Hypothetical predicted protein [Mytilus galloprovincialis]|uniref:Uncharacterized protein n=1 Tax=Mytilus galloprovincialis TaxID=29158 RepID=A0A8B6DWC1_MYTGA|nr:Hypothetical predicted protein [Mytilus galloprovincialis]
MAKLRQMNIVKSPDEIENDEIAKHVLVDVKKVLTHTKAQRSKDSLVTKHIILAAVSGESVTENRCKKKLASKLEVPIRRLSGECMKQRKLILESTHDRAIVEARYPIFKSQADMFAETLCPKGTNKEHYKTECLNRKCQNCGVANLLLMPEENDTTDEAIEVTWEKCSAREEIQSSYFQRTEVSLHVSIIYRHAVLEYDGKDSTTENPNIIKEHFFVVSNDDKHDHHFVHEVQNQIKEYLNSISYNVSTMHEYTDGCQCQYKSRHCMGDVSNGQQDFGYDRLIRNYFETSHAKGPQDAAGGYVKRQADLAILRRKATIQTAHDFYKFANENLQETRDSSVCLRRVFRFIDNIDRNRDRYFKSIPQNRNIHQIISEREGLLSVRNLSCYSCDSCLLNMAHSCQHTELVGLVKNIQTEKERGCAIVEDISPDDDFEVVDMIRKGSLVASYTDDEGEDF